jgi:hypothetical protein
MTDSFHSEAEQELVEAIEFYEGREPGLGDDFALMVEEAIDRILRFPEASPKVWGEARRCLVDRFPFGVVYSIKPASIFILAIMHLSREPDYWTHRQP